MIDAKEMGAGDVEPDAFYYDKAKELIGRERGSEPLFLFVYTVANHFPWDTKFRPDLTPDWKPLNANKEADEYIRRQRMSARDYEAFVASLKKSYPDDAFLIVRFGDHPPAIGAQAGRTRIDRCGNRRARHEARPPLLHDLLFNRPDQLQTHRSVFGARST